MKFPFSEQSPRMIGHPDELRPLRELRSPLSTSAIRERVLERAARPALWGQLRNILAECLVVGVAGTAVFLLTGPVTQRDLSHGTHGSDGTHHSGGTDRTNELAMKDGATANTQFNNISNPPKPANTLNPNVSQTLFSDNSLHPTPAAISNNSVIPTSLISPASFFNLHPSAFPLPRFGLRPFPEARFFRKSA